MQSIINDALKNAELEKDLSDVSVKLLSMQALTTENQALKNMISAVWDAIA